MPMTRQTKKGKTSAKTPTKPMEKLVIKHAAKTPPRMLEKQVENVEKKKCKKTKEVVEDTKKVYLKKSILPFLQRNQKREDSLGKT